ncbi:MAG: glycosyltransferase [Candidatus Staskawiczbacteria bacterium]|jgi:glycosyltransferase involved in cell wall biosynthesis
MDIEEYSKYKQFYTGEIPELLLKYLDKKNWESFMDIGCGDGSLLYALDKRGYLAARTVYAVDLSKNRIDLVKKINKDIKCFVEDACNMKSARNNSVDFIASAQLIEHVQNDEDLIREINRVLTDNGTVYLSTIFKKWYGWYFYRCNGKWVLDPTHLREYTADNQLFDVLNRNNFEIIESKKILASRPLTDFILRKMHAGRYVYNNHFILKMLRTIKFPVPGYYEWEIICKKKAARTFSKNRYKIAIISPTTHYYHVPLYRRLASSPEIDLTVYYCSNEAIIGSDVKKTYGATGRFSNEDILNGYSYKFMRNYSLRPSYLRWPFGLVNFGIWQEIKNGKYDAVVLQAWTYLTCYIAFLACLRFKTPVLFMTDANVASESFRPKTRIFFKKIILKFLFKKANGFLTAGIANEEFYKYYGVEPQKMVRFYFSWGYEKFFAAAQQTRSMRGSIRNSLGIKKDDFVVIYVGRLAQEKNPEIILDAFNAISIKNKKLFFVGDGPLRSKIEQQIKKQKIDGVLITGFQNREKIVDFYAVADVLVLPSSSETWGIVVNEAMCFGLPIIASDQVGAAPDLVKNGYNGFIFPVGDVEGIIGAINNLINLPFSERLSFGRRSSDIIKEWIDKINPIQQIVGLLKNIRNTGK